MDQDPRGRSRVLELVISDPRVRFPEFEEYRSGGPPTGITVIYIRVPLDAYYTTITASEISFRDFGLDSYYTAITGCVLLNII